MLIKRLMASPPLKVARLRKSYSGTRVASWEKENSQGTCVLESVVMTFCFDSCFLLVYIYRAETQRNKTSHVGQTTRLSVVMEAEIF